MPEASAFLIAVTHFGSKANSQARCGASARYAEEAKLREQRASCSQFLNLKVNGRLIQTLTGVSPCMAGVKREDRAASRAD